MALTFTKRLSSNMTSVFGKRILIEKNGNAHVIEERKKKHSEREEKISSNSNENGHSLLRLGVYRTTRITICI